MKQVVIHYKKFIYTIILFFITATTFGQDTLASLKDTTLLADSIVPAAAEITEYTPTQKTLNGTASFYAQKFEGRKTANGEIFSHKKMTAACNKLPLGTWIEVTNLRNNKKVIVKTNDRLHPSMNRVVDLTMAAAKKLDFISSGLTKVKVVVLGKNYNKKAINK